MKASNIVVKISAIVLLIAAVLKGWQLLTEPVANNDIWSYRPLLEIKIPDLVKRKGPVRNKLYNGKDLTLKDF